MNETKEHQHWLEELNQQANRYEAQGLSNYDAIEQVASDLKLSVLSEGDVCRVYQTPDGILVNCWIEPQSVEHGQLPKSKLDNHIAWFSTTKK